MERKGRDKVRRGGGKVRGWKRGGRWRGKVRGWKKGGRWRGKGGTKCGEEEE